MSTTLTEIAENLAEDIASARDFELVQRLKFSIHNYRALFLRRDIAQRTGRIDEHFFQELKCVELEQVDPASAECCDVESDCTIKRTVKTIPKPIRLRAGKLYDYIGKATGNHAFGMIMPDQVRFLSGNKYTKNFTRYYSLPDSKIYVTNFTGDLITIRGIFENPEEAALFNSCDGSPCYNPDVDRYPCSRDMLATIIDGIRTGKLNVLRVTQDEEEEEIPLRQNI